MKASVRIEKLTIPTYAAGEEERLPMFFEKRVYQGSSGRVYPYPVTESIGDEKKDAEYTAVVLENDFIKVVVLPELGGRIYSAEDKITGYDFVYRNRVIKPALVGLLGPWISGGIEFNWPQHHRPTTFMPATFTVKRLPHAACVWVGETEGMFSLRQVTCISLEDDSARIRISTDVYNPGQLPQTFLWWANPAYAVNDDTATIMPPDVNAVMDHGKRAVSTFPVATGEPAIYRGVFRADPGRDCFVDMKGFSKGFVTVNGINLGRYWKVGPQRSLYLPAPFLKEENEIFVFEQEGSRAESLNIGSRHYL